VAIPGCWSRVFIDSQRCFVYGPSLGRLYLLTREESLQRPLQRLLGLGSLTFNDNLSDPAQRIVHDRPSLREMLLLPAPRFLCIGYRLLRCSRHVMPFGLAVALVRRLACSSRALRHDTVAGIGRLIHAIETAIGFADCYPRALMTSYLCLRSGRTCNLVIGSLVPTRKMHAWCTTDGELPYEALPEHYMYRPLLIFTLLPTPAIA
jgi:Transglutaminase-like superfamily